MTEAETVRTIFDLYLNLKSFSKLVAELDRRGIVTKRRKTKVAKYNGAIPFTYGPLAYFLKNRVSWRQMVRGRGRSHRRSRYLRTGSRTPQIQSSRP